MTDLDTDRITELAEQNHENIMAIAKENDVESQLTDDVDGAKFASVLLGPSEKDEDDEPTGEERAMALLEQNAENLVTLATKLKVRKSRVDTSASGVARSPGLAKALGFPTTSDSEDEESDSRSLADKVRF